MTNCTLSWSDGFNAVEDKGLMPDMATDEQLACPDFMVGVWSCVGEYMGRLGQPLTPEQVLENPVLVKSHGVGTAIRMAEDGKKPSATQQLDEHFMYVWVERMVSHSAQSRDEIEALFSPQELKALLAHNELFRLILSLAR